MSKRLLPNDRKEQIMQKAMGLAGRGGYNNVKRADVAAAAGVAEGLVSKYWGTMVQLRRAIMRRAVTERNLLIIAQGLAGGDAQARKAPEALRREAVETLL